MAQTPEESFSSLFSSKLYDTENTLDIYAYSFVNLPAEAIYEPKVIEQFSDVIAKCHVYFIGFLPIVDIIEVSSKNENLFIRISILGRTHELKIKLPVGYALRQTGDSYYLHKSDNDPILGLDPRSLARYLRSIDDNLSFSVQYIGQSYGKSGERNALDRLLKHESLQKISLKGAPAGYGIELLILEIVPETSVMTMFNPFAKIKDESHKRIGLGLDKLYGTSERERIALYEAAMISYFRPKYNLEFKDSFPSTNLKVLEDCYEKDFSTLIAEICFDELPYNLESGAVKRQHSHIAVHHLHKGEERKAFFFGEG